ncbi:MAG: L-serine ammonia-lyase, iron-sulfur-dependent, subunit alpha [Paludibacteraceae bacterium]
MSSIREIYRIGYGPSSSHTMAPRKAAEMFYAKHPDAAHYEVTLYGSLAATGKGHMTDVAIMQSIPGIQILWEPHVFKPFHPNGMEFRAYDEAGRETAQWLVYSVGGGALVEEQDPLQRQDPSHPSLQREGVRLATIDEGNSPAFSFCRGSWKGAEGRGGSSLSSILRYCEASGKGYWEYVEECEGKEIWDYLRLVWQTMIEAVERGIDAEGVLPGPLHLRRKANTYFVKASGYKDNIRTRALVFAYALAVAEENAAGGKIVTAPTCGSCGVLPAVLYHLWKSKDFSETRILHALATAGLIGNVVKHNASISGAEVGCQGEVGVACAMAAAAATQLFGGSVAQIEYAAEMGLEHHLGMTCDPVCGLVQIPCIERNAYAAARALDANLYASFTDGNHRVSFDKVVEVMKQTGHDLPSLYKETGEGGLAKDWK